MYISNKDLEILQEIELYLKLYSINEKLLQERNQTRQIGIE